MKVKDFLEQSPRKIITVQPDLTVKNAMSRLIQNKISCLPVVTPGGSLIGIITDKDIFKAAYEKPEAFNEGRVEDLMSTELIVGLEDDSFDYIAGVMTNNRIRHIPIINKKKLVGLISLGDIVKAHMTSAEIENRYLKQIISDPYPG